MNSESIQRPNMTSQEIISWGDDRGTSPEIARAIHRIVDNRFEFDFDGERDMQKVWEAPCDDEEEIVELAWRYADDDETELYWGQATIKRERNGGEFGRD